MWKSAHDTGFMVAGAAKADLLSDFYWAVERGISEGTGITEFRKAFDAIVEEHGWSHTGSRDWRSRVIYRTNMATSYAAGRDAQIEAGGFGYKMYRHSDSVARPRPHHVSWNGLVLPVDDPFWDTHSAPNGWGCQCYIVGVRDEAAATRMGGRWGDSPPDDWDSIDPKTGEQIGIDKGWGYRPGATVNGKNIGLSQKIGALPTALGAALALDMAGSSAFHSWVKNPQGTWPIASISEQDAVSIGAETKAVELSAETMQKQLRVHPDISASDYPLVQQTISQGQRIQDTPQTLIYLLEVAGYVTVVKATQTGKAIFMTSFRRLSSNQVKRDEEVRRILRKDKK